MYDVLHQKRESVMRTTIAIDDDLLAAAKHLAEREQKTLGEVVSGLVRQGLSSTCRVSRSHRNGIPLLAVGNPAIPVTLELVNQLRDEYP